MIPRRKLTIRSPKNKQYDTRPDGSLLCGPGCFSRVNILKKRFLDEKDALTYSIERKVEGQQKPYACEYCKGFHLTHKVSKSKKGKRR